ncbi:Cu(I)-responsive transcriptional regulator [Chelatococcus reniformis]|uniref:Heavy metal-dependent transcription regulator 2 n=1 Tax=Chelatococcus reniformis TaxID=1494448 RepID=A0A916UTF2_9HYPH|nr:Cu(I)-responsive transcriptional regulator [Chelatococcus reniformis]GGC86085.1 heavy metal-dependent transcription regulator 2 [Chelatococcus reniformis]
MNIGQAATRSGVSAKMIRYYEAIGLIPAPARRDSNYRDYDVSDVHRLSFVRRARDLGFPLERIRILLALWGDDGRSNTEVKAIALAHVTELEAQRASLDEMLRVLRRLADSCEGDGRSDCPIIDGLEGLGPQASGKGSGDKGSGEKGSDEACRA